MKTYRNEYLRVTHNDAHPPRNRAEAKMVAKVIEFLTEKPVSVVNKHKQRSLVAFRNELVQLSADYQREGLGFVEVVPIKSDGNTFYFSVYGRGRGTYTLIIRKAT